MPDPANREQLSDRSTPRVIMVEGVPWVSHEFHERFINEMDAENERLREAIALHARTLDDRALGHPEHNQRDRDSIDNDLYNLTRRLDPAWWDERVPGMAGSPRPVDEIQAQEGTNG